MITWACQLLASLLSCGGQLCQKQATRPSKSRRRGRHILGWLGLALLALGGGMLLWLSVLQSIPVSVAYPMLSIGYIVNAFAAWWLFGESITAQKLVGIGFIVIGVWLVARS